jgi:hypothetical protein
MELCGLGKDELSIPLLLKNFRTTVSFLNASVQKEAKTDIFSFIQEKNQK